MGRWLDRVGQDILKNLDLALPGAALFPFFFFLFFFSLLFFFLFSLAGLLSRYPGVPDGCQDWIAPAVEGSQQGGGGWSEMSQSDFFEIALSTINRGYPLWALRWQISCQIKTKTKQDLPCKTMASCSENLAMAPKSCATRGLIRPNEEEVVSRQRLTGDAQCRERSDDYTL